MLNIRDYSIKTKLTLMNMAVSGTTLLLACTAFGAYELTAYRSSMVQSLSIQAQMVGANSASALLFDDTKAAVNTLSALKAVPSVLSAGIYKLTGEPFAVYRRDAGGHTPPMPSIPTGQTEAHWFADEELKLIRPIEFQGKLIGTVYIRSDLQEMNDRVLRYAGIVAAVLLLSLTAAFFLIMMFQRAATLPILQLAETARIVSREKTYSVRAPSTDSHDEVGLLIQAFNEMLVQIQKRDADLQTSQDELEQRVAQRTAELDATNKELEAFTYSVAHDLRAPLRHIQGFSNALMESLGPQLEPEAQKWLNHIGEGTLQMGRLIDDLLSLARVGRQELRLQITGLNSLVQDVLRDLKNETQGRDIHWKVGELPFVECDPGLMKQVLYNLLSNAAKYSRPRNPAVIDIGQILVEGRPVNFVRDNGVGFNMKYANKLFGVFQRLHRKEDFEGTGVGLATVQRIIHKHGGRVWADAEIDKGATFFFSLASQNDGRQTSNGHEGEKSEC
jgi:signal transduction histidine kinase